LATSYMGRRHFRPSVPGLAAVVALHVAVIYALVNGLQGMLVSKPVPPMAAGPAAPRAMPPVTVVQHVGPVPPTPQNERDRPVTPPHVGGGAPGADYPAAYAGTGRSGRVVVDCMIEADGVPTNNRVLNVAGGSAFAPATMLWLTGPGHPVYRPAMQDGKPRAEKRKWVVTFLPPDEP
jgi:hypothetical protein